MTPSARPPLARLPLAAVALGVLALHAIVLTRYGWFRDELYYVSCARRLAWGYVDQPPFSIAVLAALRTMFGDGLAVLRLASAAVAASLAFFVGALTRELDGGRYAQVVAALAVSLGPLVLALGHFYSMNVFDLAFWFAALALFVRATRAPTRARWLALGVVLGLGLLNKWSVMWLGAGLAAALLQRPALRSLLRTPGPWIAALVAAALFAPHVLWEVRNGWPTLEFMHHASQNKLQAVGPLALLGNQLLLLGPGAVPLWLAGFAAAVAPRALRLPEASRPGTYPLLVVYLATFVIVFGQRHARAEYVALGALPLFAVSAVWLEARGRALRAALPALAVLLAVPLLPLALPLLPVERLIAYRQRLGLAPQTEEHHTMGRLSQHEADMFGWPEFADSVAQAAARLTPQERARAIVVVGNYGEAGALEQFGRGRVPTVACQHNNWYLWGPPAWDGKVAILVGRDSAAAAGEFGRVEVVGTAGHPLAMPYEQDLPILIARDFHADLGQAWKQGKDYN